jgi:hypothetical protein
MKKIFMNVLISAVMGLSSAVVMADNNPIHMEEQAIKMMNTKMREVANSMKDKKIDVTLYGYNNQTYIALLSSLDGVENTEIDPSLVPIIRSEGEYQADDFMVGSYQCKHVIFRAAPKMNKVFFVGRDCKTLEQ